MRIDGEGTDLILIMRWPEVLEGGVVWERRACVGVIGFLGKEFVGLIGHIFSALVKKTWYLNYALYGLSTPLLISNFFLFSASQCHPF